MKTRNVMMLWALLALLTYRILEKPTACTLIYILVSYALGYDSDIIQTRNQNDEVESAVFMHRFIPLNETSRGWPVEVTYHIVECGSRRAEPIVFFHGLGESWAVWKVLYRRITDYYHVCIDDTLSPFTL